MCEDLALSSVRPIGSNGQHLKLRVKSRGKISDVIGWNMGEYCGTLSNNCHIDLAFLPEFYEWGGQRGIQFKAHDLRKTQQERDLNNEAPDRILVGKVYLTLKRIISPNCTVNISENLLRGHVKNCFQIEVSQTNVCLALKILEELDLIYLSTGTYGFTIGLKECPKEKLDINTSPTYAAGRRQNWADQEV
jgi:hypothetical protein